MEKIKNILKPGKSQDNDALYGTDQSPKHPGDLTGEGSHLGGTSHNTSGTRNPVSSSEHNTGVGNTSTGLGGQTAPSGTGLGATGAQSTQTGHHAGQGSHLAGATSGIPSHSTGVTTTTTTQTHTGQRLGRDAGLTGATAGGVGLAEHERHGQHSGLGSPTSTGIGSHQTTGVHSGTTSGPHTSDLANRADPRVDSDSSRYPNQSGQQMTAHPRTLGDAQIGGGSGSIGQSALSSLTGQSSGPAAHSGVIETGTTPRHVPGEWIDETDTSRYAGTGVHDTNTASGSHLGRDTTALGTAGVVGSGLQSHGNNLTHGSQTGSGAGYTGSQQGISSSTGQQSGAAGLGSSTASSNFARASQTGSGPGYTGTQQPTSTSSGHHLGRDAALVGGAGAVGSGIHSHQDRSRDTGYTGTGQNPTQHAGSHGPHATDTANLLDPHVNTRGAGGLEDAHHHSPSQGGGAEEADHHHGRNTAIGAGSVAAAGLGAHQYGQHQNERATGTTGNSGLGHSTGLDSTRGPGVGNNSGISHSATGPAPHTAGPHSKDWENVVDPRVNPNNSASKGAQAQTGYQTGPQSTTDSSGHHYGLDATLGAGAVGAAGLANSQHQKHQTGSDTGALNPASTRQTISGLSSGPAPTTAGSHSSDVLNKLDPRVTANPTVAQGNPQAQSVLGKSDKSHASTGGYAAQPSSSHHGEYNHGRDAALGGGATSAFVGDSRHDQSGVASSRVPHPESSTTAQRSTFDPTIAGSKDHHYGRDAAVAGGVGTAAYAAGSHHNQGQSTDPSRVHGSSTTSSADPSRVHGSSTQDPYSTSSTHRSAVNDPTTDRSKDHHYGRDSAVVGGAAGAGGAAYEADKHKREKDLETAQREAEKEHKHDLKQAEKDHKHDVKRAEKQAEKDEKHHEKKKGGFLSFLHRDKSNKYTAEEEADFDRQEREHNASQSHTGRNAALGGAAVTGAGAYAADKHHDADTNKSLPTAPGNHGIGTGAGTQNALAGNTSSTTHHDPNTHGTPLPEKPAGKDIGDILHGVERNRGVTGAAGFPDQPGFGDGTTGHQHHSVPEATTDQQGRPIGSSTTGATGAGYGTHQAGREFPLGHSKHDSGYTDKTSPTHATQHQSGRHTGRDAAVLGGAALAGHNGTTHQSGLAGSQGQSGLTGHHPGLTGSQSQSVLTGQQTLSGYQSVLDPSQQTGTSTGQQVYRQHDTASGYQTGRETSGLGSTGQGYETNNTGSSSLTGSKTSDHSGRNRLHKDPPASHPASQGFFGSDNQGTHVPASGGETERLVDQGKNHLDRDSGVANAPPANSSTNY